MLIDYGEYSDGGTDEPLRKYVLFSGLTYYPSEGVEDLRATADTLEELRQYVSSTHTYDGMQWWQICDRETLKVVEEGNAISGKPEER